MNTEDRLLALEWDTVAERNNLESLDQRIIDYTEMLRHVRKARRRALGRIRRNVKRLAELKKGDAS